MNPVDEVIRHFQQSTESLLHSPTSQHAREANDQILDYVLERIEKWHSKTRREFGTGGITIFDKFERM